ncbi:MAG: class I SAM-dependent methyltransferase [Bacteroidales bacterium]
MTEKTISPRIFISLGIHSAAIIAYQLILMQLLSIVQWHHFAFMIISIAMLGFGASGTFIALFRKKLIRNFYSIYPVLIVASGLSMLIVLPLSRLEGFELDVFKLFSEGSQLWVLLFNYLLFFIPFFLGATSIGMLFIKASQNIGKCYFFNLAGSGLGGIFILFLTGWFLPEQVFVFTAMLSIIAGIISYHPSKKAFLITLSSISFVLAILLLIFGFPLNPSEYKSISKSLNLPKAEVEFKEPDTHGVIEIVTSPALRYAPALSMSYTGNVPVRKSVFVNGNFYGIIPEFSDEKKHIHSFTTMALPYIVKKREDVLVLNAGTGVDISHALSESAKRVDATINNLGIIEIMQNEYAEESGNLFNLEKVNIYHSDARIFLSKVMESRYDLIKMPVMDAFGGTSGLNALEENYELTLEAFDLMWEALKPEGVIAITSWMDYPPRTSLKIAATISETARNKGIESPGNHIAAIRSWGTVTYILKKTQITNAEINRIQEFSKEKYLDILYLKNTDIQNRNYYNKLEDASFLTYIDDIINNESSSIYKNYGFDIKPSTDDKPHFSQFIRLKNIQHIASVYGFSQLPFLELGYLTVIVTLIQSIILAIILIILPLFRLKAGSGKSSIFLFFASIGIGYMFLEIILIQKFVLYFGYPIYAITAVIATMLIGSGVGSLYSSRLKNPGKASPFAALIIALILIIYAFILPLVLDTTLNYSETLKIFLALVLISVPAFFMGMPFPVTIRYLSDKNPALIPWSWGINGCFSVISSALAMFLALEIGFRAVMAGTVVCYIIAFLSLSGNIIKRTDK